MPTIPPIPPDDGADADYAAPHNPVPQTSNLKPQTSSPPLAAALDRLTARCMAELYAFLGPHDAQYRITARLMGEGTAAARWEWAFRSLCICAPAAYTDRWLDDHAPALPPPPCPRCGGPREWRPFGVAHCPACRWNEEAR